MDDRYSVSWVSDKLVLQNGGINGFGLFAKERIDKDELLIIQGGRILHISQVDGAERANEYGYHAFQIKLEHYIFPCVIGGESVLDGIFCVNHSCSPNSGFFDAITLVAMKDISAGDEITYDYALTDVEQENEIPWVSMMCSCGSPNCRELITASDWRIEELQKRYDGYFSPYIRDLIHAGGLGEKWQ